jgi:hypothetical protein
MRKVSDKDVAEIKTHILCSKTFFEDAAVYEIMWKNVAERGRPQMTHALCMLDNLGYTHTEY